MRSTHCLRFDQSCTFWDCFDISIHARKDCQHLASARQRSLAPSTCVVSTNREDHLKTRPRTVLTAYQCKHPPLYHWYQGCSPCCTSMWILQRVEAGRSGRIRLILYTKRRQRQKRLEGPATLYTINSTMRQLLLFVERSARAFLQGSKRAL